MASPNPKLQYQLGIVGGKNTTIKNYPYQIIWKVENIFLCGGFIITEKFILTSAFCCGLGNHFTIKAGSTYLSSGGITVKVKKIKKHPKYHFDDFPEYDACIAELQHPLNFTSQIKPIEIADEEPEDKKMATVTGWGVTNESLLSEVLQKVEVSITNRQKCEKDYSEIVKITSRMICAGLDGKAPCVGDTGGPLTVDGKVVGIVSFGNECGKAGYPGVYTNIANDEIRKWINKIAGV